MKQPHYITEDAEDVISYYIELTRDELKSMMVNGDDTACAFYVKKCNEDGTLTTADVKCLEGAVNNLDAYAASVGAELFGVKGGLYENIEKQLFCYAVLEQLGSVDGHKKLKKAYKAHSLLIDGFDEKILTAKLAKLVTEIATAKFDGLVIKLIAASKSDTVDYKDANVVSYAKVKNGVRTTYTTLYLSYCRDKYRDRTVTRLINLLNDNLTDIAPKVGLKFFNIYRFASLEKHYGDNEAKQLETADITETDDANINVTVSDERLTTAATVCTACGAPIKDGKCTACGKTYGTSDVKHGDIVIQRSKNMEALLCTQCHAPVTLDKNGAGAVCPYCGTTFIVNGNVLSSNVGGLDFNSIRQDMPQDATLPEVKFIRADVMGDRLSAVIPDSFKVMSEEYRRIKYPVNPPEYIYTTPDTCVNLCLSANGMALEDKNVFVFGRQILTTLKGLRKDAVFGEAKEFTVGGGKHVFFIDFMTQALDQSIYNAMFFFELGGRQATGSWNCLGKDRWYWAQIFEHAIKTMRFN